MKDTLLTKMDGLLCLAVVTAAVVFVCDVQVANSEPLSSGRTHVTSEIDMVLSPVDKLTPATSSTRKKRFSFELNGVRSTSSEDVQQQELEEQVAKEQTMLHRLLLKLINLYTPQPLTKRLGSNIDGHAEKGLAYMYRTDFGKRSSRGKRGAAIKDKDGEDAYSNDYNEDYNELQLF